MSSKMAPLRRSRRARPQRDVSPDSISPSASPTKALSNAAFPEKLRMLLDEESTTLVDWLPTNDAFYIHDIDVFAVKVLPKYFRHSNLTSFQRQLNLYGFRRVTKGDRKGAYHHPYFLRDRPDLIELVTRKQRKDSTSPETYKATATPLPPAHTPPAPRELAKLVAAATPAPAGVQAFRPLAAGGLPTKKLNKTSSCRSLVGDLSKVTVPAPLPEKDVPVATSPLATPNPTMNLVHFGLSPAPKAMSDGTGGCSRSVSMTQLVVPTPANASGGALVFRGLGCDPPHRVPSIPRCLSRNSELALLESYLDPDMKEFLADDIDLGDIDLEEVFSPPPPLPSLSETPTVFH